MPRKRSTGRASPPSTRQRHPASPGQNGHEAAVSAGLARIFREGRAGAAQGDLLHIGLAVAKEVTESEFGFFAEADRSSGALRDVAIGPTVWDAGEGVLRGWGFLLNDPASHPDLRIPSGHPPLRALLGVPLVHAGEMLGLVGLANREGGYHAEQLQAAEALATGIAQAIFRKRAEEVHAQSQRRCGELTEFYDVQRRRAEAALRASEHRLRLAQQAAKAGSWEWDLRSDANTWSDELWSLFGLAPCSCQPSFAAWLESVVAEDREPTARALRAAAAAGGELAVEWRVLHSAPPPRWLMARGRPQRDATGSVIRYHGIVFDITERKLAEETLRASEQAKSVLLERLNLAHRMAGIGSWEWDLRSDRIWWSEETYQIFGITPAEFSPGFGPNEEFVHPEDRPVYRAAFLHSLQTGEPLDFDVRLLLRDGGVRQCNAKGRVVRDDRGQPLRFVGTIMDITDRKRAEEALRENESRRTAAEAAEAERRRFLDMIETMPVMISLLTPDYRVAFANRSFREKFGEPRGRRCFECCFGRCEPCESCPNEQVLSTRQPHRWEVAIPEGSLIELYAFPFTDVNGSPMTLHMGLDITAHKTAELALKSLNASLEQHVAERTEAFQMLHDVASEANRSMSLRQVLSHCLLRMTTYHRWNLGHAWLPAGDDPGALVLAHLCYRDDVGRFSRFRRRTSTLRLRRNEGLPGRVFASGEWAWITDQPVALADPRQALAEESGLRTAIAFPVLVRGKIAAVLEFFSDCALQPDDRLLRVMTGAGMQLGRALERAEFEEHLLTIADEVQQSIAQDLHDDIGQELTGLGLKAETLADVLVQEEARMAPLAADIAGSLDRTRRKVRGLSHRLLPAELEEGSLVFALSQLAAAANKGEEGECTFSCPRTDPVISSRAAMHLYRIAQEAVNNAVRHSRAKNIRIGLNCRGGETVLRIEDDGIGFPGKPSQSRGMGLSTMRYRAELIDAQLEIGPGLHGGTAVTCRLPPSHPTLRRSRRRGTKRTEGT